MIAKEGLLFIVAGFSITLLLLFVAVRFDSLIGFIFCIVFAFLSIMTTYFFRDPDRTFEYKPGIVVSPADGKVIGIDTIDHPYTGEKTIKISIFLSVFDVHVNRTPINGTVDYVKYNPGKFFAAFEDKASDLNEQTEIGIISEFNSKIIVKQIAGLIARRIICNYEENEKVTAGDRFGLIKFGSRTELFLPSNSLIDIKVGDRVKGSETIIGLLKAAVESKSPAQEMES